MEQITTAVAAMVPSIMYWMLWGLILLILVLALAGGYFYLSYRYTAIVFPLNGSGKYGHYSIGKPRKNKFKKNRDGSAFLRLWPLFNKKRMDPISPEYIYAGNRIYCFEYDGEIIPGIIDISQAEKDNLQAVIRPVPHYLRNWQSLEHKKNALEFAKNNWWETNKMFVYMLIAVAFCCALCGVTIYFSYQFATGGVGAVNNLASKIDGLGIITAGAPAG